MRGGSSFHGLGVPWFGGSHLEVPRFGCVSVQEFGSPSFLGFLGLGVSWFRGCPTLGMPWFRGCPVSRVPGFGGQGATGRVGQGSFPSLFWSICPHVPPSGSSEDSGDSRHSRAACHTQTCPYPPQGHCPCPTEGENVTGHWHDDQWCPLGGHSTPVQPWGPWGGHRAPCQSPSPWCPESQAPEETLPCQPKTFQLAPCCHLPRTPQPGWHRGHQSPWEGGTRKESSSPQGQDRLGDPVPH